MLSVNQASGKISVLLRRFRFSEYLYHLFQKLVVLIAMHFPCKYKIDLGETVTKYLVTDCKYMKIICVNGK